jgi:antirestriction protein ArdC
LTVIKAVSSRFGIIRVEALWVLYRYRHKTHWTGHESRLKRDLKHRFGSSAYAVEELIAEMGSAFLCSDLEISPEVREDHAAYLESWLKVLQEDKRAIFTAAAQAQRSTDFLHGLQKKDQAIAS